MSQPVVQVDAFTSEKFGGTPAAICVMKEAADEAWMQSVAFEMNLSETAYLHPEGDGYRLRWFTPGTEVELCGHATVAAAHALWEDGYVAKDTECRFYTKSGLLTARLEEDWICVDFPMQTVEPISEPEGLSKALDATVLSWSNNSLGYIVVEVEDEESLRAMTPDFSALNCFNFHGYCVTARGDGADIDFVLRFFAPALGANEDPLTGSAHCVLALYWAEKFGKTELVAYQASVRGGDIRVSVGANLVTLGGQAVITMRGDLI
jgi:PhzF family phenazine biosynthesis protein